MITSKPTARLLAHLCKQNHIRHIVICPGSRSAPLVAAFTEDNFFSCISLADERAAAFYALGIAQQTGIATAIICTSGSAVLNLAPAVCEAYYQHVPLLAITADRPAGAAEAGENQALLNQHLFLAQFVKSYVNIPDEKNLSDANAKKLQQTIDLSSEAQAGPVHINMQFEEPLYDFLSIENSVPLPILETNVVSLQTDQDSLQYIQHKYNRFKKVLVIVGMHKPGNVQLQQALHELNRHPHVILFTEPLSNLHVRNAVTDTDATLSVVPNEFNSTLQTDLVITLGGPYLSKRLRNFLKQHPPIEHWDIAEGSNYTKGRDMFGCLHPFNKTNESEMIQLLASLDFEQPDDYKTCWLTYQKQAENITNNYTKNIIWSDWKAIEQVVHHLPENSVLHYGNSSPVRYGSLMKHRPAITVYANRGTSGIDGCVSTAAGAASVHSGLTVVITGDISFLYDSNALWNAQLSKNLRIVVLNNGGGHIFGLLDGPQKIPKHKTYFETRHQYRFEHLASMYQLAYYICPARHNGESEKILNDLLPDFLNPDLGRAAILEIETNPEQSAAVYKNYFEALRKTHEQT